MTLTQEQIDLMQNTYATLSSEISHLEAVVHPDIIKRLRAAQANIEAVFHEQWKSEEDKWNMNYAALNKISEEHGFQSVWSITEVPAAAMNQPTGLKIKSISYESGWGKAQKKAIKPNATWCDIWAACDAMIVASGDTHHIFIESVTLKKNSKNEYEIFCGS